jgi:hypothetical protein
MAKIVSKTRFFVLPDVPALADVENIRVYYAPAPGPIIDADLNALPEVPSVDIVYEQGVLLYGVNIPAQVPITVEGDWVLGVASIDKEGNTSDVDVLTNFFDFTAPPAPKWKK